MRGPGRLILISIVLGVFTTFVVAWILALFTPPSYRMVRTASKPVGGGVATIDIYRYDRIGSTVISGISRALPGAAAPTDSSDIDSLVPAWARPHLVSWDWHGSPVAGQAGYVHREIRILGWPMPALWCLTDSVPNPVGYWGFEPVSGIGWPGDWQGFGGQYPGTKPVVLPYQPVWGPFLLDVLVFALLWSIPLIGLGRARRIMRARKGRCVRCGYQLAESAPGSPGERGSPARRKGAGAACPECGAVSQSSRARSAPIQK